MGLGRERTRLEGPGSRAPGTSLPAPGAQPRSRADPAQSTGAEAFPKGGAAGPHLEDYVSHETLKRQEVIFEAFPLP